MYTLEKLYYYLSCQPFRKISKFAVSLSKHLCHRRSYFRFTHFNILQTISSLKRTSKNKKKVLTQGLINHKIYLMNLISNIVP